MKTEEEIQEYVANELRDLIITLVILLLLSLLLR